MEVQVSVVVIVADGITTYRKFFKLYKSLNDVEDGVTYKVKNIYDPSRYSIHASNGFICNYLDTYGLCRMCPTLYNYT